MAGWDPKCHCGVGDHPKCNENYVVLWCQCIKVLGRIHSPLTATGYNTVLSAYQGAGVSAVGEA